MEEKVFLYIVGTAGSGKSTLTHAFREWLAYRGLDAITINLDPGAENLRYSPDVDIREWISLKEVMEEYDLGPNGAQIVCADMIALNIDKLKEAIGSYKTNYVILDTPGQIELFVFREAGKILTLSLDPKRSLVAFLLDPILTRTASDFVSQLLLSVTTKFRLNLPMVNVLSKCDLLKEEKLMEIKNWSCIDERLYDTIMNERASISRELSEQIMHLLRHFGEEFSLIPISSEDFTGMEDLYNALQMSFRGGEDTLSD